MYPLHTHSPPVSSFTQGYRRHTQKREKDSWPEMYSAWPSIHLCGARESLGRHLLCFPPQKINKREKKKLFQKSKNPARSFTVIRDRERASLSVKILLTRHHHSSFYATAHLPGLRERTKQQLHSSPSVSLTPAGV